DSEHQRRCRRPAEAEGAAPGRGLHLPLRLAQVNLLHHAMRERVDPFRRKTFSAAENSKEKIGIELESCSHAGLAAPEMVPGLSVVDASANVFDEIGALHF